MSISIWGKGNSSKLLARALNCKRNLKRADVIIRYGKVDYPQRFNHEVNTAEAVKLASHKYKSLKVIEEAGIRVPPCSTNLNDLTKDRFSGIILARKFYHSKGTDIKCLYFKEGRNDIVRNAQGIQLNGSDSWFVGSDYFITYLKPRAEYRYHVAFGKVILPTKKVLADGAIDDSIIRNHQDGKWIQVVCEETPRFSEACIKAVKALGLDFGAVDFLNYKKEAVILEVNTAPGLQVQNRLDAYVKAFRENL